VGRHHCAGLGSERILQRLRDEVERRDLTWVRTTRMGCNQQHHQGPIMIVYPDGVWYGRLEPDDLIEIIEHHLIGGRPVERLRIVPDGPWSATALT
jgi:(2Fe-2S) ferredoxin